MPLLAAWTPPGQPAGRPALPGFGTIFYFSWRIALHLFWKPLAKPG